MRIIFYTESATPTEAEKEGIGQLIRQGHAVVVRDANYWKIEPCDAIVTRRKKIADAYDVPVHRDDSEPPVLDEKIYGLLVEAGYDTPTAIADASDEELLSVPGIGPASLKKIRE